MSFLTFTSRLTPFTANQLRRVTLPDDDMPSTAYKDSICTALAGLTGLQDLSVRFRSFADPRTKGTEWRPYHLRWLKQLCASLPQLRYIHDFVRRDEYGGYHGFRLSTDNVTRLDEFGSIDIDAEYQLWLDKNKQRRIKSRLSGSRSRLSGSRSRLNGMQRKAAKPDPSRMRASHETLQVNCSQDAGVMCQALQACYDNVQRAGESLPAGLFPQASSTCKRLMPGGLCCECT